MLTCALELMSCSLASSLPFKPEERQRHVHLPAPTYTRRYQHVEKAWPAAHHPPIYQGRSNTHLSKHAKAHDGVTLSPTSQDSHDNVQTSTMSAKQYSAQHERWTNIGNANIEESRDRIEKAVAESCGFCVLHVASIRCVSFSAQCGVRML
jgi:hypothetical protein